MLGVQPHWGGGGEKNDSMRMLDAGSKDNIIRMMNNKKNVSFILWKCLRVLEGDKRAKMLSICHVLYRQVERLCGGWVGIWGRS